MIVPRDQRVVLVAVMQGAVVGWPRPITTWVPKTTRQQATISVEWKSLRSSVGEESVLNSPRVRLELIWAWASAAYYFTNEHNTASIRMHETHAFRPVARLREIRGVTADDGRSELILFEASR